MPTGLELAQRYEGLHADAEQEERELRRLASEVLATRAAAEQERTGGSRALAAAYLPRLDREALADAERRTGFRGFSRFDPLTAMERERIRLERELAHLRADERYVRRDYLVGPNGSITRRIAEAVEMLEPWEKECARFEDLPSFLELVDTRYDTDHFTRRWWEPAYWRLWAAGDAVCSALGLADFGDDVLPAYEKVRKPRDEWRAQVNAIERERDEVLALVQRHDTDLDRMIRLAEIYLDEAVRALAEHLCDADPALLEQWSDGDRAVIVQVRKLAGLAAKMAHLRELADGIGAWADTLAERRTDYRRKASKYRYGKRAWRQYGARSWSDKSALTLRKSAERRAKVEAQLHRVRRYEDYASFDVTVNPPEVWWFEFTGKAPPTWAPSLRDWYLRHPELTVHHDDEDHGDAVAASVATHRLDGLGDLS